MRIASLVPSSTEMLFALGLGESVVGVTHECDWPPGASELPHLTATVLPEGLSAGEIDAAVKSVVGEGKALYSLDEERLAALEPDLIVTQAVCDVCAVSYEDVVEVAARLPGTPRVVQQDPSSLAEVFEDVTRLGVEIGEEERARRASKGIEQGAPAETRSGAEPRAARLRAELEARLDAVRAAVAGAPRPRVVALEWLDPPFIGGHWVPEMIELAGGEDVAGVAGAKSPQVTWEDLAGLDPDVVVVMPCGWYADEARAQALAHRPEIEALGPARAFAVDAASTYSRPGPRLVDGTEFLAHLLHPDLLPAPAGIAFHRVPRSG